MQEHSREIGTIEVGGIVNNKEFEVINKQTMKTIEDFSDKLPKYQLPNATVSAVDAIYKSIDCSILHASTTKMISSVWVTTLSDIYLNFQNCYKAFEGVTTTLAEMSKRITQFVPKIKFPVMDEDIRKRWRFVRIASEINFPIYFEIDTELQDKILEICDQYLEETQEYPIKEIKQCIFDYYNHDMLNMILNTWLEQGWIDSERKEALREAVEVYEERRYYSTGSILMCQLGGLITELYEATNTRMMMPLEEKKEILSLYHVKKFDSEKAKIVQMMSMQSEGIYLWYNSAEYFMNYTYSSSEDMLVFDRNPGRHKICHGVQTNYGQKEIALKAIIVVDIVCQLGMQMMNEIKQAS